MSDDGPSPLPGPPAPDEEVLYGRDRSARVFVSSQMRTRTGAKVFERERASLADAVDGIPRMYPWLWERNAPIGDYSAENVCIRVAGTSDCLVLIVGRELTPITRREYEAARAAGAHCFIFQDSRQEPEEDAQAFISEERSHAITGRFSSADDLARRAVDHLSERAVFFLRQGILHRRKSRDSSSAPVEDRGAEWSEPPPQRKYEVEEVAFGEAPGKPETFRSVADMVADLRARADGGDHSAAFWELSDLAFALWENARGDLALEVLQDLHEIVPPGTMRPVDDAWILNVEALALARVGRQAEAVELWERMLVVGERLDEKHLRATALQNLAIDALNRGDLSTAKAQARESMEILHELDEVRAVLQLLNTLVLVAIEEEDYEQAARDLDVYEAAARSADDFKLLTSAHGNRGRLLVAQGRFEEAECQYRTALRYSRLTGDPLAEILALQNFGAVCADQQRFGHAMRWYRKGIRLAETYELPLQVEVLHRSLAGMLHHADRNSEAIKEFDHARRAAWSLGDRQGWAESTMNMGAVYIIGNDGESALRLLEQAASTFRELGSLEWELRARSNIAAAHKTLGELESAIDGFEAALSLLAADAHDERASLLRQAAEASLERPTLLERASDLFTKALDEEASYLDQTEVASRAASAGAFLSRAGARDFSLPFFDRAIAELAAVDSADPRIIDVLNDRAIAFERLGRDDDARADLLRCVSLAERFGDTAREQKSLANLGEVERSRGDKTAAVEALVRAVSLARQAGNSDALAHAVGNLALALEEDARPAEAEAALRDLEELADAEGVIDWKAQATAGYGRLAFIRGEHDQAAERYSAATLLYRESGSDKIVFALGGHLESLARAGQRHGADDVVQGLMERLETGEDPELVISYLGRAGMAWLKRGELDEGKSLLGIAATVGINAIGEEDPDDDEAASFRPLGHAIGYLVLGAREAPAIDETELYDGLVELLNTRRAGAGDSLRPLIQMMREEMSDQNSRREGLTRGARLTKFTWSRAPSYRLDGCG